MVYVKTYVHFWTYLAQFFLKCEIFQTTVREKTKIYIIFFIFFEKPVDYEIVWKL